MKILLFGPEGQVGWELQRSLAPLGKVVSLGRDGAEGLQGDLTDLAGLARTVAAAKPDVVVNAAAYTAVDRAEGEPDLTRRINGEAPGVLALEAKRQGALLVHYSTDYVFDGRSSCPWRETDDPNPLNLYGATKLEGERRIRGSGCRHLIFRTSWVYAARRKNFVRTMLRLAQERESLQVIDDQVGAPTGAELIADVTAQVLPRVIEHPEKAGTYHLAAAGETSWYGYAKALIERAGARGWHLRVSPSEIQAVPTEHFSTRAVRPKNSRLDCRALTATFALNLPTWWPGVRRVLDEWAELQPVELTRGVNT